MRSPRGARRLVSDALATTGVLTDGKALVRADSAFYGRGLIGAALRAGADVSVTVRMDPNVKAAITTVDDQAWETIEYTDAIFDEATGRWISRAEVAVVPFTAFTSQKKNDRVPGRLVVRRIPDLNPTSVDGQETLFDSWRFHAFFTTTDPTLLGTVAADKTHRGHAVIEQVHADLKNSALAHLPSGTFAAKRRLAGACSDRVQPHPRRSNTHRPRAVQGHHSHRPPQAHHRPGTDRVIGTADHPSPADRLALGNRLAPTAHPRMRPTHRGNQLIKPPSDRPTRIPQWNHLTARSGTHPCSHRRQRHPQRTRTHPRRRSVDRG